jgi:hypothetical protein
LSHNLQIFTLSSVRETKSYKTDIAQKRYQVKTIDDWSSAYDCNKFKASIQRRKQVNNQSVITMADEVPATETAPVEEKGSGGKTDELLKVVDDNEEPEGHPVAETAPVAEKGGGKTDELLQVVDDNEEPEVYNETEDIIENNASEPPVVADEPPVAADEPPTATDKPEADVPVVPNPSSGDDDDDTTDEENDWKEVLPPPPAPIKAEDADERYGSTKPPPDTPTTVATAGTTPAPSVPVKPTANPSQKQQSSQEQEGEPDFSHYKTNVARRLWEAQEKAEKAGVKSSPDMVPLTREFQNYRKHMNNLVRYVDEYQQAMRVMRAKRKQVSDVQYPL